MPLTFMLALLWLASFSLRVSISSWVFCCLSSWTELTPVPSFVPSLFFWPLPPSLLELGTFSFSLLPPRDLFPSSVSFLALEDGSGEGHGLVGVATTALDCIVVLPGGFVWIIFDL